MIHITEYPAPADKNAKPSGTFEVSWLGLVDYLKSYEERRALCGTNCEGSKCRYKRGPGFSLVRLREPWRKDENVAAVTGAMFDVDHYCVKDESETTEEHLARAKEEAPQKLKAMFDALYGHAFLTYHTHTSRPDFPKLRLIMPLSRECTPAEYRELGPKLVEVFKIPTKPMDMLSRMYFLPSIPEGVEDVDLETREGADIDVEAMLKEAIVMEQAVSIPQKAAKILSDSRQLEAQDLNKLRETEPADFPPASRELLERARKRLREYGPAIEGEGGDGRTVQVGAILLNDYALTWEEAWPLALEWNKTCQPPWEEADLVQKLENGARYAKGEHGQARAAEIMRTRLAKKLAGATGDGPPEITLSADVQGMVDQAEAALSADPGIFKRHGGLVQIVRDDVDLPFLKRPKGAPRAAELVKATIVERLATCARWRKSGKKGGFTRPPAYIAETLMARSQWPHLRHLEGIIESPVLRPNGSVLQSPGYDPSTGLWLEGSGLSVSIPDNPTRDDAKAALETLLEPAADFPFEKEEHKSAYVAAVLTYFARHAFAGQLPLILIEANTPGSGKGLLADTIATICTGRSMARMANTLDDDEMRKRLLAIALAGDTQVLIDNIRGPLGTPSLDMALTAGELRDRVLGETRMVSAHLDALFFGTGNNVELHGDTPRRTLHIRLESPLERPEERTGFKHPDLLGWIRARRGALVAAALTSLRAFCLAGRPGSRARPWGSFEPWQRLVCHAVSWLGMPDPERTREALQASTASDKNQVVTVLEAWRRVDPTGQGLTTSAFLAKIREPFPAGRNDVFADVRASIVDLCPGRTGGLPDAKQLGTLLKRFRRRVVGGRTVDNRPGRGGSAIWFVSSAQRGGDGDHGGAVSLPEEILDVGKCKNNDYFIGTGELPHHGRQPQAGRQPRRGRDTKTADRRRVHRPRRAVKSGESGRDSAVRRPAE